MNHDTLIRQWLWMQAMEFALEDVARQSKTVLFPNKDFHEWKFLGFDKIREQCFRHALDNWETPEYHGHGASQLHFSTGCDIDLTNTKVTAEYRHVIVTIKWPEVKRFIQKLLEPQYKQLTLLEMLAEQAMEETA